MYFKVGVRLIQEFQIHIRQFVSIGVFFNAPLRTLSFFSRCRTFEEIGNHCLNILLGSPVKFSQDGIGGLHRLQNMKAFLFSKQGIAEEEKISYWLKWTDVGRAARLQSRVRPTQSEHRSVPGNWLDGLLISNCFLIKNDSRNGIRRHGVGQLFLELQKIEPDVEIDCQTENRVDFSDSLAHEFVKISRG